MDYIDLMNAREINLEIQLNENIITSTIPDTVIITNEKIASRLLDMGFLVYYEENSKAYISDRTLSLTFLSIQEILDFCHEYNVVLVFQQNTNIVKLLI